MRGEALQVVEEEKDVGVIVHKSLKPSNNCKKAANTAKAVLRQIARSFHFRDKSIFKKLFCQFVRPHLEFAPAWSPWLQADVDILEDVQRKAIKMMVGLKSKTYEEGCKEVGLDSLVIQRERADMIQVHKIMHGMDQISAETFFKRAANPGGRVTRQS